VVTRAALVALLLLRAGGARADGADENRAARVGQLLGVYADAERHDRLMLGGTGLFASSLTIGIGAYLLAERQQYGPNYVALAGWLDAGPPEYTFVRSLVYLFVPGSMETLQHHFSAALLAGSDAALGELEVAWLRAARRARTWRYVNTAIYGLFAGITLGYGGYLLFSRPLDTPVQEGQYIIGAELLVTGLGHTAHALHDAFLPSAVERAWRAYAAGLAPATRPYVTISPFVVVGAGAAVVGVQGTL
jgi:hypothetical protein